MNNKTRWVVPGFFVLLAVLIWLAVAFMGVTGWMIMMRDGFFIAYPILMLAMILGAAGLTYLTADEIGCARRGRR